MVSTDLALGVGGAGAFEAKVVAGGAVVVTGQRGVGPRSGRALSQALLLVQVDDVDHVDEGAFGAVCGSDVAGETIGAALLANVVSGVLELAIRTSGRTCCGAEDQVIVGAQINCAGVAIVNGRAETSGANVVAGGASVVSGIAPESIRA